MHVGLPQCIKPFPAAELEAVSVFIYRKKRGMWRKILPNIQVPVRQIYKLLQCLFIRRRGRGCKKRPWPTFPDTASAFSSQNGQVGK